MEINGCSEAKRKTFNNSNQYNMPWETISNNIKDMSCEAKLVNTYQDVAIMETGRCRPAKNMRTEARVRKY